MCAGDRDFDINTVSLRKDTEIYDRIKESKARPAAQTSGSNNSAGNQVTCTRMLVCECVCLSSGNDAASGGGKRKRQGRFGNSHRGEIFSLYQLQIVCMRAFAFQGQGSGGHYAPSYGRKRGDFGRRFNDTRGGGKGKGKGKGKREATEDPYGGYNAKKGRASFDVEHEIEKLRQAYSK